MIAGQQRFGTMRQADGRDPRVVQYCKISGYPNSNLTYYVIVLHNAGMFNTALHKSHTKFQHKIESTQPAVHSFKKDPGVPYPARRGDNKSGMTRLVGHTKKYSHIPVCVGIFI